MASQLENVLKLLELSRRTPIYYEEIIESVPPTSLGVSSKKEFRKVYFSTQRKQLLDRLKLALFLASGHLWRGLAPSYMKTILAELPSQLSYARLARNTPELGFNAPQWYQLLTPGLEARISPPSSDMMVPPPGKLITNFSHLRTTRFHFDSSYIKQLIQAASYYGFEIETARISPASIVIEFYRNYLSKVAYIKEFFEGRTLGGPFTLTGKGTKGYIFHPRKEAALLETSRIFSLSRFGTPGQFEDYNVVKTYLKNPNPEVSDHLWICLTGIFEGGRTDLWELVLRQAPKLEQLSMLFQARRISPSVGLGFYIRSFTPFLRSVRDNHDGDVKEFARHTLIGGNSLTELLIIDADLESLDLLAEQGYIWSKKEIELARTLGYLDLVKYMGDDI